MPRHYRKVPDDQLPLFADDRFTGGRIINVASVPQRSVFRYPGGKTWLVPYLRRWLRSLPEKPSRLIEPFAGGGIVGLSAVMENLVESVILVERDPQVAAVWHTVLSDDAAWLAERIREFHLTADTVAAELARSASSTREMAFQTILRNRVNRGGILAPGAGRVKHGENGKGLASRWYPLTLSKRILAIAAIKDRIQFFEGDGIQTIRQSASYADAVFFIDPPYTIGNKRAGARLYTFSEIDHAALFDAADSITGSFLMTYADDSRVRDLAQQHDFELRTVAMKNTHHAQLSELLISRRLDWLELP